VKLVVDILELFWKPDARTNNWRTADNVDGLSSSASMNVTAVFNELSFLSDTA